MSSETEAPPWAHDLFEPPDPDLYETEARRLGDIWKLETIPDNAVEIAQSRRRNEPLLISAMMAVDPGQDFGLDLSQRLRIYNAETGVYEDCGMAVLTARCLQVFGDHYTKLLRTWLYDGFEANHALDLIGDVRRDDLLACVNGTVILARGDLTPPDKRNRLVRYVDADWRDPTPAESKLWQDTLDQWLPDKDDQRLVQQVAGSILGDRSAPRQALYLVGTAGSGKSTLLKLLAKLAGGATAAVGFDEMSERFSLADLAVARVNFMDDQTFSGHRSSAVFKKVVSHEPVHMERKHRDAFTGVSKCVCLISGNDFPTFAGMGDAGIWDRIRIVEMRSELSGTVVLNFENRLWDGASAAILRWAYEGWKDLGGAVRYTATGRHDETVARAKQTANPLADLLLEHFEKDLSGAGFTSSDLAAWVKREIEQMTGDPFAAQRESEGRKMIPTVKRLFGFDTVSDYRVLVNGKRVSIVKLKYKEQ